MNNIVGVLAKFNFPHRSKYWSECYLIEEGPKDVVIWQKNLGNTKNKRKNSKKGDKMKAKELGKQLGNKPKNLIVFSAGS